MNLEEGLKVATELKLPVIVRPSYVLGGQGMKICYQMSELVEYLANAFVKDKKNPVLIDKYLTGKELEVDAISDGKTVLIPGIMEHIERAGIHSGDSMTVYPPQTVSKQVTQSIVETTRKIALGLDVKGLINIQYIEFEGELFVIEVNPRASRTVPYISKVSGVPIVELATRVSMGEPLASLGYGEGLYKEPDLIAVKVPVFSTHKLPDVEISLGPEMKSTGEVLGIGKTYAEALYKGFIAAKNAPIKETPTLLMTLNDEEKMRLKKEDCPSRYKYMATRGTCMVLKDLGIPATQVRKITKDVPNILDYIRDGAIDLIINAPTLGDDATRDGFTMRRAAAERNIPVYTSMDTFRAWCFAKEKITNASVTEVYELKSFK
jgi:carbamoyl-phosphate synthase large subunit